MMASVFQLDAGIGMRSEIQDGYYTGRPAGPFTYREGKAEAIRDVAAREGFDLGESWASVAPESALPMLRPVGHPVAVNPDSELLRVAREEGWQVMTFDRLRRRIRIGAAIAGVGAVAGGGGYVAARLRPSGRERMWRRL